MCKDYYEATPLRTQPVGDEDESAETGSDAETSTLVGVPA